MSKRVLLAVGVVLCLNCSLFGQSVDEIISKHIEVLGGMENIQAIKSLKINGTMFMGAMGIEGSFTRQQRRPSQVRMDISFSGQTIVQAYDGEIAWEIIPFMGDPTAHVMPEDDARQMMQEADFDGPLVEHKKKGHQIELVGKEEMEGTEVYKLKVTLKEGDIIYSFLDAENYVELKRITRQTQRGTGTEIDVETTFSDFKEVDGVMMPHALTIKSGQGPIDLAVTSYETNVELDGSLFRMPEADE